MLISHYMAQEILDAWEDRKKLKAKFKKFSERYPNDHEFLSLNEEFNNYLKFEDEKVLVMIKKKLEELRNIRRLESGGGSGLPFRDRRHLGEKQTNRR